MNTAKGLGSSTCPKEVVTCYNLIRCAVMLQSMALGFKKATCCAEKVCKGHGMHGYIRILGIN